MTNSYTKKSRATVLAALIISSALVLTITSFWNDSLIVDEIPHVGSGYGYVKKLDYRLNPEHPPLAKALAAAPLLFLNLTQTSFQTKFWLEDVNGQWDFGRFLIFQSGNDTDLITRVVKFPMLIFFILSAILIYKWTKELYPSISQNALIRGDSPLKVHFNLAAFIALILFVFSPTVVAHSRFVTTDLPSLFGVLFATFFFLKYLQDQTRKNFWLAGLFFGIAMLTKFSTFLLVPYFLILTLIYIWVFKPHKKLLLFTSYLLLLVISFVLIVWPVYYLFTFDYPPESQLRDTEFLLGSFGNRSLAEFNEFLSDKPVVRGLGQYMLGLLMVSQRAVGGNTTYFLGEVSAEGWKYYFPVVYALKEPLAWWLLTIIAILSIAIKFSIFNFAYSAEAASAAKAGQFSKVGNWLRNHFVEFAMLLWLAIYWGTSIRGNLNIGVRHLLPTYPFIIILVSGQLSKIKIFLQRKPKKFLTSYFLLLTFLLGWYIFENIRVWPYYLTYFNQLAGGPSGGYRYVVDSNLDWGQDLKRLGQWVEENNIKEIHLDYFGWSDPAYYLGEKYRHLWAGKYKNAAQFIDETGGGYLAVSATFYMGSREKIETSYAWLDQFKPAAVIGNSIRVWKLE